MAPGNEMSVGQARRDKIQKRLQQEKEIAGNKENADNNELIKWMEFALQQNDEELAAFPTEQLQLIDMVNIDDESDVSMDDESDMNVDDKGENTGGQNKPKMTKKKSKKNTGKKAGKKGRLPSQVMQSIEEEDDDEDEESYASENLFSEGSEEESESDSETDDSDTDDSTAYRDPVLGRALVARPGPDCRRSKPVGWVGQRSTQFINMYGKKSAAIYRLQDGCASPEYMANPPQDQCFTNTNNTLGDKPSESGIGKKFTKRHILGVFGVAIPCRGSSPSPKDVELINPDKVKNWRNVPTRLLIAWNIGTEEEPEVVKTWETRSVLRDRWKKGTDKSIYRAAVQAEKRQAETLAGKRKAESRSPSVGLIADRVRQQREKSLGIRATTPAIRGEKSHKKPRASSASDTKTVNELREVFLADYMQLMRLDEGTKFEDLTMKQKRECLAAWKEEKAESGIA